MVRSTSGVVEFLTEFETNLYSFRGPAYDQTARRRSTRGRHCGDGSALVKGFVAHCFSGAAMQFTQLRPCGLLVYLGLL